MKLVSELEANPENPRIITEERLDLLKGALHEFGDLGGIIFNRKSKRLVSGHQRAKVFEDSDITIEHEYKKPTRTGTVAEGFIVLDGERFKYREVKWDINKEKAAAIAANRTAGDWDNERLADWMGDLSLEGFNLDLTMFSALDRDSMFGGEKEKKPKKEKSRVASDEVQQVNLLFRREEHDEFSDLSKRFGDLYKLESLSDTLLVALRVACEHSFPTSKPATKLRKQESRRAVQ